MNRPLACLLAASAAALLAGACESPTAATSSVGAVVSLDSLRTADGAGLPCCTVDTAGVTASIVGGTLTFRKRATYTDTAFTPGGPMDSACVTGVPSGSSVDPGRSLVTLPDGTVEMVIGCHVGTYSLALGQRLDLGNGAADTTDIVISSGTYAWNWGTLALTATAGAPVTATMSADTVIARVAGHVYKLQSVFHGY